VRSAECYEYDAEARRQDRMRRKAPLTWDLYEEALQVEVKFYAAGGQERQQRLDEITLSLGEAACRGEQSPELCLRAADILDRLKAETAAVGCTCHRGSVCGPACRYSHHAGCAAEVK
jgi:hypothetical protein